MRKMVILAVVLALIAAEAAGQSHLRHLVADYLDYYQLSRTHLSLEKDAPEPREVQPPTMGEVVACRKSVDSITDTSAEQRRLPEFHTSVCF